MSVPGPVWVLSPHLLVAQAVTAALRSVGVPAETRRWESVVDDDGSPVPVVSRPAVVVAIVDGVDNSAVVGHVEALAQPGDTILGLELAHGGQAAECYSLYATARARDLLLGKPVALISDPTQPQLDRYRRPLRYVVLGMAGALLLAGVVYVLTLPVA